MMRKESQRRSGFALKFEAIDCDSEVGMGGQCSTECGGYYTASSGLLTSPLYPKPYPVADCLYVISQPSGSYINVTILNFDLNCDVGGPDYLQLRDGHSLDSPLIGTFCGNGSAIPTLIQTTQNILLVR